MTNQTSTTENSPPDFTESVHDIIMEKTDNGTTIVEFLLSVMQGELPGFKECHRMEAVRLLEKFTGVQVRSLINGLDLQPPTRRERRDTRRADRRIHTELAQIVKEKTDNGRTIVEFLHSAMQGELPDFKPHHRMSASRELLRQGSQYTRVQEEVEAEPEETPEEKEERLRREDYERRRQEAFDFSLHGPLYYRVYPDDWCSCEDRRHDCKGNELTEEERAKAETTAPGYDIFIYSDPERQAAFRARYEAYMTRINPGVDISEYLSALRWRKPKGDP